MRFVYFAVVFLFFCSVGRGDLITYRLIDGAAGDQNGHRLEGTIILDPACGSTCTSLHSWEYTISGPTLNYSTNSNVIGALFFNPSGLFEATPQALSVNFGAASGNQMILDLNGLAWSIESPPAPAPKDMQYRAFDNGNLGWSTTPQPNTITIATAVPEPSSFGLVGFSVVFLACLRSMAAKVQRCGSTAS